MQLNYFAQDALNNTGVGIDNSMFSDFAFLSGYDNVFSGSMIFGGIPEYQYYKNVGTGSTTTTTTGGGGCTPTSTVQDQVYLDPQINGETVANVPWNGANDTETAEAFCDEQAQPYVEHAIFGQQQNGSYQVRNYNNTAWQNTNYAAPYQSITCGDIVMTNDCTVVGTGTSTTTTQQYVVNNKQIYQEVWQIKRLLVYGLFFYVMFSLYHVYKKYANLK